MPSRSLDDLHPLLKPKAEAFWTQCKQAGIDIIFTCTYRSSAEQDAEYAKGRTAPGNIVTNARGGQSKHNNTENGVPASLAFDIAIKGKSWLNWDTSSPEWQKAVEIGQGLGLVSGSTWKSIKDWPHFEIQGVS